MAFEFRGAPERRLDPASPGDASARLILDERAFRFLLNQDAMATEKPAEGIRLFVKDLYALRALVRTKLVRADAARTVARVEVPTKPGGGGIDRTVPDFAALNPDYDPLVVEVGITGHTS